MWPRFAALSRCWAGGGGAKTDNDSEKTGTPASLHGLTNDLRRQPGRRFGLVGVHHDSWRQEKHVTRLLDPPFAFEFLFQRAPAIRTDVELLAIHFFWQTLLGLPAQITE